MHYLENHVDVKDLRIIVNQKGNKYLTRLKILLKKYHLRKNQAKKNHQKRKKTILKVLLVHC